VASGTLNAGQEAYGCAGVTALTVRKENATSITHKENDHAQTTIHHDHWRSFGYGRFWPRRLHDHVAVLERVAFGERRQT
jgi:hypothetical protein